jgi:hypothetical protein
MYYPDGSYSLTKEEVEKLSAISCRSCKFLHLKFHNPSSEDTNDFWCGLNVTFPHWGIVELPKGLICNSYERDIKIDKFIEKYKS